MLLLANVTGFLSEFLIHGRAAAIHPSSTDTPSSFSQTHYCDQLKQTAGRSGRLPSGRNEARRKQEQHTLLNTSVNQTQHAAELRQGLISRYEGGRCSFRATKSQGSSETLCRTSLMNESRKTSFKRTNQITRFQIH